MAFAHGKTTKVLVDEFDLSGQFSQTTVSKTRSIADVSVYGGEDRSFIAGLAEGTLNLQGPLDTATDANDQLLDAALSATNQTVSISIEGASTIGQRVTLMSALSSDYKPRMTVDDAVRLSASRSADGGIRSGVVLHPLTQRASGANYASVDEGASTANGGVAHLHVTQFSGTNATIKVTDSTDDAVFADHITFTSVTAVGAQRSTSAGLVNRYTRVELTGTFTTITFTVGFSRHRL
jgi:hypothetical protein